jgi:hypothetical protein
MDMYVSFSSLTANPDQSLEICGGRSGTGTRFSLTMSISPRHIIPLSVQTHTSLPMRCSYQNDKLKNPAKIPNNKSLSEIVEGYVGKFFFVCFIQPDIHLLSPAAYSVLHIPLHCLIHFLTLRFVSRPAL